MPLYRAHSIASRIEDEISRILPNSDIAIHTEPQVGGDLTTIIRNIASEIPGIQGVHGIIVRKIARHISISFHIEIDPNVSIFQAHSIASQLEEQIRSKLKNVSSVITHLEPASKSSEFTYSTESGNILQRKILQIKEEIPEIISLHNIQLLLRKGKYSISLHCSVNASLSLEKSP